jgi:hypothetical protein
MRWPVVMAALAACGCGGDRTLFNQLEQDGSSPDGSAPDGSGVCPPLNCVDGYRPSPQCSCVPVSCTSDADCTDVGQAVCDTSKGVCTASSMVAKCAAVFTCQNAIKAGGRCDCHLDCQCDPQNASGMGATSCQAGGTCMPRCSDQKDPAQFCNCFQPGSVCAPNGSCALPCKINYDCRGVWDLAPLDCPGSQVNDADSNGGFCIQKLNNGLNTTPCGGG